MTRIVDSFICEVYETHLNNLRGFVQHGFRCPVWSPAHLTFGLDLQKHLLCSSDPSAGQAKETFACQNRHDSDIDVAF